jgi:hypothetical protein
MRGERQRARVMMIATMRVSFFFLGKREAEIGVKDSGMSTNSVSDVICPCDGCCCARASNGCVLKLLNCGVSVIAQVPPTLIICSSLAVGIAIVNGNEISLTIVLSLLAFYQF